MDESIRCYMLTTIFETLNSQTLKPLSLPFFNLLGLWIFIDENVHIRQGFEVIPQMLVACMTFFKAIES